MDFNTSEEYVSVIGTSFLDPITTLLETLESFNPGGPNEVQASPLENGYSVALIVLTVLMLESAIGRIQYVRKEKPKNSVQFIRSSYPDSAFADDIEELFVVRDVIAHNHIWEAKFDRSDEVGMKFVRLKKSKIKIRDLRSNSPQTASVSVNPPSPF